MAVTWLLGCPEVVVTWLLGCPEVAVVIQLCGC